ncbi:MAG TPA: hypothetical protein VLE89_07430 [Chlamydiales bacterium]|nr:hypothetical protein [Chlamydiales bacterium]
MAAASGGSTQAPNLIQDLRSGIERYRKTVEHLEKEQKALETSSKKWGEWSVQWTPAYIASMNETAIKPLMYEAANDYRGYRGTKYETVKIALDFLGALSKRSNPVSLPEDWRAKFKEACYSLSSWDKGQQLRGKMLRCLIVMSSEIQSKLKRFEVATGTATTDLNKALENARAHYKLPVHSPWRGLLNKSGLDDTITELTDPTKREANSVVDYDTLGAQFAAKTKVAKELEVPAATEQAQTVYTPKKAAKELALILGELEKIADETAPKPSVPAKPPGSALPLPVSSAAPEIPEVVRDQAGPAKVGDKSETPAAAPVDGSVSAAKKESLAAAPGSTTPAAQPEVSSGGAVQTGTVPAASASEPAPMEAVPEEQGGDSDEPSSTVAEIPVQGPANKPAETPKGELTENWATVAGAKPTKPPLPRGDGKKSNAA